MRKYSVNVNMVEHQQSIMSVLGIDLWIPKTGVPTRTYISDLYRDQQSIRTDEVADLNYLAPVVLDQPVLDQPSRSSIVERKRTADQQYEGVNTAGNNKTGNSADQFAEASAQAAVDEIIPIQIAAFEYQAWVTASWVILLDATQLSAEQLKLWHNIQMVDAGHFASLKWPFALMPLQDGRGVHAYVQGFVDALSSEKRLICLGHLTHWVSSSALLLPSLQDMLNEPALKRQLWDAMRNTQ